MQTEKLGQQRQTKCASYLFTCITVNEIWHQGFGQVARPSMQIHTRANKYAWLVMIIQRNAHGETCCTDNKQTHSSDNLILIQIYCMLKELLPTPNPNSTKLNTYNLQEHSAGLEYFGNNYYNQLKKLASMFNYTSIDLSQCDQDISWQVCYTHKDLIYIHVDITEWVV